MSQTFVKSNQSTNSTITILKRMNTFKIMIKLDDIFKYIFFVYFYTNQLKILYMFSIKNILLYLIYIFINIRNKKKGFESEILNLVISMWVTSSILIQLCTTKL